MAAIDVLQALCACSLFHTLYPAELGASPRRAMTSMLLGNGVLALALRAQLSALPFKWVGGRSWQAGTDYCVGCCDGMQSRTACSFDPRFPYQPHCTKGT